MTKQTDKPKRRSLLTDAIKQVDLIHTTLVGMTGIVVLLYAAALLPVLELHPVTDPYAAAVMGAAAFAGIVGLYAMNVRVHKSVTAQARLTEVLVNSLGQGFLTFNKQSVCGPMYSLACLDVLETEPAGKHLADVLRVPQGSREDFLGWVEVLFDPTHALGFDDAIRFLPQTFPHSEGRDIALAYKSITGEHHDLRHVVVIATDRTEETEAQARAEERQQFANMICKIFKERNQFIVTIGHIREFIALTARPDLGFDDLATILRQLHTLKAAVRYFNLIKFGALVHAVESQLRHTEIVSRDDLRLVVATTHDAIAAEFGRVLVEVRDLIGLEEEQRGTVYEISEDQVYAYADFLKSADAPPHLVRKYLADIVALPIRNCFQSFERELLDLAQQMDKNVRPVSYTGDNVSILAQPMQGFFFALTHMARNIIDHGIEPPVTRMARGKDSSGQVNVHTAVQHGQAQEQFLVIEISDDGAGIDPNRVRQKLAALDPEGDWRFEDDQNVMQRIFTWGVSTRDGVNDVSGHGVGLEAVMREAHKLGGSMSVTSEIYQGAKFTIRLPYMMDLPKPDPGPMQRGA